jgi:NAD(P)-dependent dehydrogenase (short-subunit alcohol dehydrogenase family)
LALQEFGRLDGLVVNHGILTPIKRIEDSTVEEWKKIYDANLWSALALVSASS